MAEAETLPQSVQDLVDQYGWTGKITVPPAPAYGEPGFEYTLPGLTYGAGQPGLYGPGVGGSPPRGEHSPEVIQKLIDAGFSERAIRSGDPLSMVSLAQQYLGDAEYRDVVNRAAQAENRLPTLRELGRVEPIDIDIRAMQKEGKTTSDIARTLSDMIGVDYDFLSTQYQNPANVSGYSDAQIIEAFANINVDAGPLEAVAAGFAQGFPPMLAGVQTFQRTPGGWHTKLPAAVAAFFTSDALMREMFPQIQSERFMPNLQPWYYFANFAGSETPFATIPFGVKAGEISLGKDFLTGVINTNFGKLPGFNRVFVGGRKYAGKGEEWLEEAFKAARENPGIYTTQQLYQGLIAAGAGSVVEAVAPDADITQFLVEGASAFLPTSYISNYAPSITQRVRSLGENLSASGRESKLADWLVDALDELNRMVPGELNAEQTLDLMLDHLVRTQAEGRPVSRLVPGEEGIPREPVPDSDLFELLEGAEIDLSDQTSALASGLPFFALLQQRALDEVDKFRLSEPQRKIIKDKMENGNDLLRLYLGTLIATGDESALGIARDIQQGVMTGEIEQLIGVTLANYNRVFNNARRSGDSFDADRVLYNLFIGENADSPSLLNDLRRQENILFDAIPPELQAGTTNLVEAYTAAMQRYGILGEKPRISSGNDLVFLDRVLEQFDHIANPEKYKRPQIERLEEDLGTRTTELAEKLKTDTDRIRADLEIFEADTLRRAEEQAVGKTDDQAAQLRQIAEAKIASRRLADQNRITQMEERSATATTRASSSTAAKINEIQAELMAATDITSGDLNNMRKTLQQAINNASRTGNTEHKELLQALYDATLEDLSIIEIPQEAGQADTIARRLNTAIDFEQAVRRTFSRTFVGEMGRGNLNQRPELIGEELFNGTPNVVRMRHLEMQRALHLLNEQNTGFNILGTINEEVAARAAARGEDAYGDILINLNPEGRIRDVKAAGENILFGVLNEPRFWREEPVRGPDDQPYIDAQGNAVTRIAPTPAFNTWLESNTPWMQEFYPEILADLTDTQRVNRLFDNPITPDTPMYKQAEESLAFLDAFAIPDPSAAVREMIGVPGDEARAGGTAIRDLRRFSELAMDEGKVVANGFLQSVIHDAWLYAKGALPPPLTGPQADRPQVDLNRFSAYLFDPIVKGGDSVMQVLNKTGVIEDEAVRVWRNTLEMMSDFQRLDNAGIEDLLKRIEQNPGTSYILPFMRRLVGAQVGARAGRMFPGGVATIQAPAFGAQLFENLLSNMPQSRLDDAFFELVNNPEMATHLLELGMQRRPGAATTASNLRNLNNWLAGWAGTTLEEADLTWGAREAAGEMYQQRQERGDVSPGPTAGARRREIRAQPQEEIVVEETEEGDLSPTVGFTPPPLPPLTMPQGQAPTGQAPPSTDQGAYAAAFPFDSVSEVIRSRQGLGSLG